MLPGFPGEKKAKRESEGSSRGNGIDANDAVIPSSPITRGALGQRLFPPGPPLTVAVFCFGASLLCSCVCVCLCWENLQMALDLEGLERAWTQAFPIFCPARSRRSSS
jgi:hypothetical protein